GRDHVRRAAPDPAGDRRAPAGGRVRRRRAVLRLAAAAAVLAVAVAARADERVDITATDGVQLIGELAGATGPGVVLVSAEHATRDTWKVAAQAIAARGFRTLRFD